MSPSSIPAVQVSVRPVHVFGLSVRVSEERKIRFRFCSPQRIGDDKERLKGLVVPSFLPGEATKKRPFSTFPHTPSHDPRACTSIWDANSLTLLCCGAILCIIPLSRLLFSTFGNVEIEGFTLERFEGPVLNDNMAVLTRGRTLKRTDRNVWYRAG